MIINSSDQVSRFRWLRRFPVPRDFNVTPESRIQRVRTWPAPAGATRTKAFDIYRYDPDSDDNPRLDRFHIDLDDCGPIVLDALIWIKNKVHPPISVRGRFGAARLSAKAAKFRDMLIADLPRRQRFGEAFTVDCGLVRDRGIDRKSTTRSMRDSWSRSANSTIVLVE